MCDYGHTPECSHYKSKSGCTWSKASEDKSGNAVVAFKKETKELNCVLKDCQGDAFSARSILKKIGWPPTRQQFRVRCRRNAERHFRTRETKEPSLGKNQWGRKNDRNPNAPSHEDLHQQGTSSVTKNHQQQRDCTNMFTKIRGTYQEKKGHVIQNKDCYKSHLRTGITHEKREMKVDSGASMLTMSRGDLNHQ